MTSVLIVTPTAGGITKSAFTAMIAVTISNLEFRKVRTRYMSIDSAVVADSRDALADMFLRSSCTHMLCSDSDMEPSEDLAWRMLSFGLPFVGTIYPKRLLSIENVIRAARDGRESPEAFGYEFNFMPLPGGNLIISGNGICEVDKIGFGYVLISRECLTAMLPAAIRYFSQISKSEISGFFQPLPGLPEDYSFCQRWRDVGGKVIAYADADIRHVGTYKYGVPFSVAAKAGALKSSQSSTTM